MCGLEDPDAWHKKSLYRGKDFFVDPVGHDPTTP
jgi:hypothetical protein